VTDRRSKKRQSILRVVEKLLILIVEIWGIPSSALPHTTESQRIEQRVLKTDKGSELQAFMLYHLKNRHDYVAETTAGAHEHF